MIEQLAMELDLFFSDPPAEATLLSITLPYHRRPFTTPVVPREGIYWNGGTRGSRLLGLGTAWRATLQGADRFQQAEQQLEQLHSHWSQIDPDECGHAPPLYFQYAFSEDDPMEAEWSEFPNTLLSLPRLLLSSRQGHQFITLSHPIGDTDQQQLLELWENDLDMLESLMGPQQLTERPTLLRTAPERNSSSLIQHGIDAIQQGTFEKVVLGEAQHFSLSHPLRLQSALQQLEHYNRNGIQLLFTEAGKQLIAAPPEQLLSKHENHIKADALAGTLPRGESDDEELQLGQQLLNDPKLQHEHQLVVDYIQQQLEQQCDDIQHPATPTIHKLEHIQHLLTPVEGILSKHTSLFELTESLHQSPAICGHPKANALTWLQQQENSNRGYYCGGAGWIDAAGDGEIHVILRCAIVEQKQATLYAGAGVVAGSTANQEQAEIELKIEGMVHTLSA